MNAIIEIGGVEVHTDLENRYCLNDLHKAAGNEVKHKPSEWLRNKQTVELIDEIAIEGIPAIQSKQQLGTFACKELVYAYAMWISAKFHLQVIRTFDQVKSAKVSNGRNSANRLTDARAIDFIGNMVAKVPGVRAEVIAAIKLNMMEECIGIPVTQFRIALPGIPLERLVRLNPTQIGERIGLKSDVKISAQRVNQCLLALDMQRKTESGWVVTESGAKHGESRPFQASNKHVGDQIDWYESIVELVESEMAKASLSVVKLSVATQSTQGALV